MRCRTERWKAEQRETYWVLHGIYCVFWSTQWKAVLVLVLCHSEWLHATYSVTCEYNLVKVREQGQSSSSGRMNWPIIDHIFVKFTLIYISNLLQNITTVQFLKHHSMPSMNCCYKCSPSTSRHQTQNWIHKQGQGDYTKIASLQHYSLVPMIKAHCTFPLPVLATPVWMRFTLGHPGHLGLPGRIAWPWPILILEWILFMDLVSGWQNGTIIPSGK